MLRGPISTVLLLALLHAALLVPAAHAKLTPGSFAGRVSVTDRTCIDAPFCLLPASCCTAVCNTSITATVSEEAVIITVAPSLCNAMPFEVSYAEDITPHCFQGVLNYSRSVYAPVSWLYLDQETGAIKLDYLQAFGSPPQYCLSPQFASADCSNDTVGPLVGQLDVASGGWSTSPLLYWLVLVTTLLSL